MAELLYLDTVELEYMGRNSKKVAELGNIYAEGIYRIIYDTAPHTTHHAYAYRDHFRIEQRLFPMTEGYVTYLIAERFQWRWIEYGWTEWHSRKKFPGKYVMSNALRAYGYGFGDE